MAYSKGKLKSNGNRASLCFKPFQIGNMSRRLLAYVDSAVGFIQTHPYQHYQFHGDTKLIENIIQDLPPN